MSESHSRRRRRLPDADAIREEVAERIEEARDDDTLKRPRRPRPETDLPPELIADMPPRGPDLPPDAPESPATAPDAFALPTGPIQTRSPKGARFGCDWSQVTRWSAEMAEAARRFPRATVPLIGSMMVIESCGNHFNDDGTVMQALPDGYGGGRATGAMQLKDGIWQGHVAGADMHDPAGNIMIAARLIHDWIGATGSIEGMIAEYHPGTDPHSGYNPVTYAQTVRKLLREWPAAATEPKPPVIEPAPEPTPPIDPWRPYPWPKMVDLIVEKPGERAGFDRVELRRDLIRAFVTHITDGPQSQSIEFFRDFFGTGGARQYDALTDLVIGADGRIGLLNDWRDPNRGGTRAGWANGGVDGLEGPGLAFYRRFPRINVHGLSCEHAAKAGQPWTDAEIASSIEVRTALAQELKCPWNDYPNHPSWGVSIEQAHTFFASKLCPAEPYLSTYESIILREVAKKLQAWQTGGDGDPLPPPVEPEPVVTYSDYGLTLETVANLFGTMDRYNRDGTIDELPFDPQGPLSLLWLERAEREGNFPEAESIQFLDTALTPGGDWMATWEGGWVAILPGGDTRASWVWLSEITREAPE